MAFFRAKKIYVPISIIAVLVLGVGISFFVSGRNDFEHEIIDASGGDGDIVRSMIDIQQVRDFMEEEGEEDVLSVEPAEGGAVVVLENGVVSVGGEPLRRRWFYDGEKQISGVSVTPDGNLVVLGFREEEEHLGRHQFLVIDALSGSIEGSYRSRDGEGVRFSVLDGVRLLFSEAGLVEARRLEDNDDLWSFDLAQECGDGSVEEIQAEAISGAAVLVVRCSDRNEVSATGLDASNGDVLWRRAWEGEGFPSIIPLSLATVAGADDDPVAGIVRNQFNGDYILLSDGTGRDVNPNFWEADEALVDYVEPPSGSGGEVPEVIVAVANEQEMNDRLTLQAAHEFYEKGRISMNDLEEDFLLVGGDGENARLPMVPSEWDGGVSVKISALSDILAGAV
ncbi:hypothetical protein [Nocardiopsis sp. CA-288880]|uniref:hypothetical protein n=1 Tax=Nocardiopsis sp. CA-288880 TaxID=3239995 RepID=UPI003D996F4B